MTKQEYLSALQEKLETFNRELQQEITEDYEQHFAEGLAAGKTEEEIIEELGDIEDMIGELPEEDRKQELQQAEQLSRCSDTYQGEGKPVVIDGLVADVTLEKSEDGCIYVDYTNNGDEYLTQRYRFYQYEEDGVFYAGVKEEEGAGYKNGKKMTLFGRTILAFNNVSRNNAEIKLAVRVPDGLPRIELRTKSGDVTVDRIKGNQMTVETASGDIKLTQSMAEEFRMKTASGDAELRGVTCTELNVNTRSGDVIADRVTAGTAKMQAGSGDISLREVCLDSLSAHTGSGDIVADGEICESAIQAGSGDVKATLKGKVSRVGITTGSGDVILNMDKMSGVEATLRTGSGDGVVYQGGEKHFVSGRSITVGSGDCKVAVVTGSGDAKIVC